MAANPKQEAPNQHPTPFATPPSHPPMNSRGWVGQTRPSLDALSDALKSAAEGSDDAGDK
jgi:hypothetical protein